MRIDGDTFLEVTATTEVDHPEVRRFARRAARSASEPRAGAALARAGVEIDVDVVAGRRWS